MDAEEDTTQYDEFYSYDYGDYDEGSAGAYGPLSSLEVSVNATHFR